MARQPKILSMTSVVENMAVAPSGILLPPAEAPLCHVEDEPDVEHLYPEDFNRATINGVNVDLDNEDTVAMLYENHRAGLFDDDWDCEYEYLEPPMADLPRARCDPLNRVGKPAPLWGVKLVNLQYSRSGSGIRRVAKEILRSHRRADNANFHHNSVLVATEYNSTPRVGRGCTTLKGISTPLPFQWGGGR